MSCGTTMLAGLSLILAVSIPAESGYSPECHTDCSWRNVDNILQACSQNKTFGNINKEKNMCPNFFQSSIDQDEPSKPVQNVIVRHYTASYTYADGYKHANTFTGLNISFDLDPAGFGLYTGAIIEITGVKYQAIDFDELGCFYLSFHGILNGSAVMLPDNQKKRFFFDCIRQVAPDTTYQITIKMAPFTSKPKVVRYSIPSCFYSPADYYCRIPPDEMASVWTPSIFDVDVSGHKEVILDFNLSPFDFDHYKVWLQEIKIEHGKQVNLGKREICVDIFVENYAVTGSSECTQPHNYTVTSKISEGDTTENNTIATVTFSDVKVGTYIVTLLPWPIAEDSQKCIKSGHETQCNLKESLPHEVTVYKKDDVVEQYVNMIPEVSTGSQQPEKNEHIVVIISGVFCCVFIAFLALFLYRLRIVNRKDSIYHIDPDHEEYNKSIRVKRVFVVHSFDIPYHNNVVLKLCNFLSNCCKLDVHTALWGSNNITKGVNEWIARECEEADKVLVLCSQGTNLKWRASYRDIPMQTREDAHGDIFSLFLRFQRVDYEKNPDKYVVAFMNYSSEADIPQPLTSLMKYQLMDHMEELYYHLNDLKKHSATHDFDIPALQYWDITTDAGVDLKKAVDEMKRKIVKDDNWFFTYNEIPHDIALRIKAKQQKVLNPINNQIKICSVNNPSRQSNLPINSLPDFDDISKLSDTDFQLASLASLKQITGFGDLPSFKSTHQSPDSGISTISSNFTSQEPDVKVHEWSKKNVYLNECIV